MTRTLAIILGAGTLFRFLFLGLRQLWTDELMQALILRASSPAEMLSQLKAGMALPAPLDYFIQKGFVLIFGESPWVFRLHAAILGSISIWIFYRIAHLLFGERVALYCTLLFAFYPLHYHYSQEGRPYALFILLTLISYEVLLRNLSAARTGWRDWTIFGGVALLMAYSSLLGLLVLLSQAIYVILSTASRRLVILFAITAAAVCVLVVPWLRFAWSAPNVASASEIANPKLVIRIIKEFGDNSYPMALLLFIGVTTGVRALRLHRRRKELVFLTVWALASLPALLILEIASGYFFAIRHLLHVTPALILLAGYGLSYVGERLTILERLPHLLSAPAIAYAALTLLISIWIAQSHWRSEPIDWRGTARFLAENVRDGDRLTLPATYVLLEFYAPSLEQFRTDELDPGPGSLQRDEVQRRFVACLNTLSPDPCAGFRSTAVKDPAWRRREFRGFTVFLREK